MPSRFITASHDEFDPGFQAHSHEEHVSPYSGMNMDYLAPEAQHQAEREPAGNSSTQEGRDVSHDNPNTYEAVISYYFSNPTASFKEYDEPVHRSIW